MWSWHLGKCSHVNFHRLGILERSVYVVDVEAASQVQRDLKMLIL